MTFKTYIEDWFQNFVDEHKEDSNTIESLFNHFTDREDDEPISDYLEENKTMFDYLYGLDSNKIYKEMFDIEGVADMPEYDEFMKDLLLSALNDAHVNQYDWMNDFIEDMVNHIDGYDSPLGFFNDLAYGGCSSGMIGMLIYNSDCLDFYYNHADGIESFISDLEEEWGCPIQNRDQYVHYVFVCWVCYEELAHIIARELFPEDY